MNNFLDINKQSPTKLKKSTLKSSLKSTPSYPVNDGYLNQHSEI